MISAAAGASGGLASENPPAAAAAAPVRKRAAVGAAGAAAAAALGAAAAGCAVRARPSASAGGPPPAAAAAALSAGPAAEAVTGAGSGVALPLTLPGRLISYGCLLHPAAPGLSRLAMLVSVPLLQSATVQKTRRAGWCCPQREPQMPLPQPLQRTRQRGASLLPGWGQMSEGRCSAAAAGAVHEYRRAPRGMTCLP